MNNINFDAAWRDSARVSKFFIWDASTAVALLIWCVHMRLWVFEMAIGLMIFFTILNRYGFSAGIFCRWFRGVLAGPRKIAMPEWYK